ncbi:MAG: hypothetical protein ACK4UY_05840 [Dietzia sp.]
MTSRPWSTPGETSPEELSRNWTESIPTERGVFDVVSLVEVMAVELLEGVDVGVTVVGVATAGLGAAPTAVGSLESFPHAVSAPRATGATTKGMNRRLIVSTSRR